ncbi:hypothetical protein [Pseudoalteromonas peptidolytica]|uniref:Uncharacterized protein n=1 Tax=Pseudoalteromonas peptidolytica F12-50-A1 TaxID=1315280 RepID=A0A8I0MWY4_9GAMM|nr:hypothetical protein [Pseudoalteromonas peptidolytica]MBE0347420.1 hypothetical protein [Pseudoalteromonas peptidolytica F12-50-A1]NLR13185.1 hypothetical protein [Pseudoalteromonas peptidolytica]GEK11293.1 hypothetical protein PPE03_35420 [Pseudoalteromonas peptidolytica]
MEQQQNTIWYDEASRLMFAELVNVFYARELPKLAELSDHQRLQRLLNSLPYYVERAATHIIHGDVPLELDSFNGCWLAKQKTQPKSDKVANEAFFLNKVKVGLVAPVLCAELSGVTVRLDSVDQICASGKVHCNQFGWFAMNGDSLTPPETQSIELLKPKKALMVAACCGHTWHYGKAAPPRRLTLREMLLASAINWSHVQKIKTSQ